MNTLPHCKYINFAEPQILPHLPKTQSDSFAASPCRPLTVVTRLGEVSPIWRLFNLVNLFKITKVAQIFGLLFSMVQVVY
jgi:hypothetical protein